MLPPLMSRAEYLETLFRGVDERTNFQGQCQIFDCTVMSPSPRPRPFPEGTQMALPESYVFEGATKSTAALLDETATMALLVLKDGEIVHEHYADWGGRDVNWLSMSVAKSFTSACLGIAFDEGLFDSVEDPVTKYVPALAVPGSAYDGVRIKDILQMSSGAGWNEDYADPEADIMRLAKIMGGEGTYDDFPQTLTREREPGTFNHYNSTDTQVLGMLLAAVTGRTVTDYMQEKLWHPLGMERPGYWITDNHGIEMAFGGLNVVARDYAKIGELFRLKGQWDGRQIVSRDWVEASVTPDAPHLQVGANDLSSDSLGYGYQWWLFDGDEGEFSAIGVYNQFVFVNPVRGTVIVKLSANPRYGVTNGEESYREMETAEMFRAINAALA